MMAKSRAWGSGLPHCGAGKSMPGAPGRRARGGAWLTVATDGGGGAGAGAVPMPAQPASTATSGMSIAHRPEAMRITLLQLCLGQKTILRHDNEDFDTIPACR